MYVRATFNKYVDLNNRHGGQSRETFDVSKRKKISSLGFHHWVSSWSGAILNNPERQTFDINAQGCYQNLLKRQVRGLPSVDGKRSSNLAKAKPPELAAFPQHHGDPYQLPCDPRALLRSILVAITKPKPPVLGI